MITLSQYGRISCPPSLRCCPASPTDDGKESACISARHVHALTRGCRTLSSLCHRRSIPTVRRHCAHLTLRRAPCLVLAAMPPKFSDADADISGQRSREHLRSSSAPPRGAAEPLQRSRTLPVASAASPIPLARRVLTESLAAPRSSPSPTSIPAALPLDLMTQLQRSGPSVVKTRSGSVLSRGFILKTDHYPSGMSS